MPACPTAACPAPASPAWITALPIACKIGSARAKAASSPPIMMASVPACALGTEPETGASIIAAFWTGAATEAQLAGLAAERHADIGLRLGQAIALRFAHWPLVASPEHRGVMEYDGLHRAAEVWERHIGFRHPLTNDAAA